tara:strand:+ start:253 stop:438 length:186 start_codon:yes stop_codon:yes gene_type:complete
VFYRFLLLALICYLIAKAIRVAIYRRFVSRPLEQEEQHLGVDPGPIRDAEFTEVRGSKETK